MITKILFFLVSFLLVAFAQPDLSPVCCVLASSMGYGLFWWVSSSIFSKKKRFLLALVWFGVAQAIHLSWFASDRYIGSTIYVVFALLVLCLSCTFGALTLFIERKMSFFKMLLLASIWTLGEWGRLFVLSGFSWDPVGLSLTATVWGMQLLALGGIFLLTFLVILTNLTLLKGPRFVFLWVGLAAFPYAFGWAHLAYHTHQSAQMGALPIAAIVVQTSLAPEAKMPLMGLSKEVINPLEQWRQILGMLKEHENKKIDLIVLSEAVVPYGTDLAIYPLDLLAALFEEEWGFSPVKRGPEKVGNSFIAKRLAEHFKADVVIGLEDRTSNAAFHFSPTVTQRERYEKRVLVPMGEYIPFAWCKKILKKWGIQDSFIAGKEAKVFATRIPLGVSICYEETYGHLMRESRLKGARLLANVTNDAWYPHSRLPVVHFLHGRLRAVEGGVPLLRACNTGVSCGVDSLGKTVAWLGYEKAGEKAPSGALYVSLPSYTYSTLYTFWGDWAIVGFSFSCLLLGCFQIKKNRAL